MAEQNSSKGGGRTQALANFVPPENEGRKAFLISCGVLVILIAVMSVACAALNVMGGFVSKPEIAAVGAFNAIMLGVPYLLVILWLDRNEKEPPALIMTAFLWGAVISTMISCCFNTSFGSIFGGGLTAIVSAPFIEELTKGAALLVIFLFFKKEFDNVLDGIVYGAVVGLGFAVFENWLYYVQVCNTVEQVFYLTFIRGVVAGVGSHACYTAITGAGFGLFRVMRKGVIRWAMPVLGVMLAMFVHFSWNTFAGLFLDTPLSELSAGALADRLEEGGWEVTRGPKIKKRSDHTRIRLDVEQEGLSAEGRVELFQTKSDKATEKRVEALKKEGGYLFFEAENAVVGVRITDAPIGQEITIRQQLMQRSLGPTLKEIAAGPIFLPALVIHIPFVLLVLLVTIFTLLHESRLITKYLATEGPPVLHEGEMKKLMPASRRTMHGVLLFVTFRFGAWWTRRKRNSLLIRLAFEKWHMDEEAKIDQKEEGHRHAVRILQLREQLRQLQPKD